MRKGYCVLFTSLLSFFVPWILTSIAIAQTTGSQHLYFCIYDSPQLASEGRFHSTYHGVAISSDQGVTWRSSGWTTNGSNAITHNGELLFLANDVGLLRSTDDGLHWKQVTTWDISTVLTVATRANEVWIGTPHGPYVSFDDGNTWHLRTYQLEKLNATYVSDIVFQKQVVLLATADGIYRSTDKGLHWINSGLQSTSVSRFAQADLSFGTIAAVTSGKGVYVSPDAGETWKEISAAMPTQAVNCLAFDPSDAHTMLAGTTGYGIIRSSDGGKSWQNVSGGLGSLNITAISFDPAAPDTVYAGTENGSFVSSNGGKMWQPFSLRLGHISAIIVF